MAKTYVPKYIQASQVDDVHYNNFRKNSYRKFIFL